MSRHNRPLTMPMLARAEQLRTECNISYRGIAALLELDYGRRVNEETLRRALHSRGIPKIEGRATDPERRNLGLVA